MNLRDYLHFNRMTASSLAKKLNISPNHLRSICRGDLRCGFELATKIEIITGGHVTVKELREKND